MSIRTDGKVYYLVKSQLMQMGIDTSTLAVISFGRGTYHDIILNDRIVGSYNHIDKMLRLHPQDDED